MTLFRNACSIVLLLPLVSFPDDFRRGEESLSKGDYDKAIASFTAAIEQAPNDPIAYANRAYAYFMKRDYNGAIADFTKAAQLDSKNPGIYNNRGNVYAEIHEFDKAISDYNTAIQLDPKKANAFYNRGNSYTKKREYDKAIKDYDEAIRLKPNSHDAYCNRGKAHVATGNFEKAVIDYLKAIKFDSKNPDYYHNIAWLLATCPKEDIRDGKRAVEFATIACKLSNWKDAESLATLAAAYAQSEDFKEAIHWQKKAIEIGYQKKEDGDEAKRRLQLYERSKSYQDE